MTASTAPKIGRVLIDRYDLESAVTRAVSDHVNGLAPDLPPLTWFLDDPGHGSALLGGVPPDSGPRARQTAQQWADAFGLSENPAPSSPGTRQWVGEIAWGKRRRCAVKVWCIVDRSKFEAPPR